MAFSLRLQIVRVFLIIGISVHEWTGLKMTDSEGMEVDIFPVKSQGIPFQTY
jgi:hypothetical protein